MRYAEVVARLAALPARLPAAPEALTPIRSGGPARTWPTLDRATVRRAAVLVLVVPGDDGEARVVLTERVDRGGYHSGEVSFPGGRAEPSDVDMVATALREAREEIALDPVAADVRVVGLLDPFWIPVSNFEVTPVVAVAGRRPALVASPDEVARVVEAPLAAFLPDGPIETIERRIGEWSIRYGAYVLGDLRVWGATARILGQLGALLARPDGASSGS